MLVVTDDWYLWSHRIGLAEAARDAGYEVTVATTVRDHGERIRALGLGLVHVDFARGRLSPGANLRTVRALRGVYRSRAPHLVHHVAIKPIVLGSAAAAAAAAGVRAREDGPVRVVMVSRLLRDKGVREFFEAAALVRKARKDVVFTLVGAPDDGNPTSVPREELRSWVAEGFVEWQGHREDVA